MSRTSDKEVLYKIILHYENERPILDVTFARMGTKTKILTSYSITAFELAQRLPPNLLKFNLAKFLDHYFFAIFEAIKLNVKINNVLILNLTKYYQHEIEQLIFGIFQKTTKNMVFHR